MESHSASPLTSVSSVTHCASLVMHTHCASLVTHMFNHMLAFLYMRTPAINLYYIWLLLQGSSLIISTKHLCIANCLDFWRLWKCVWPKPIQTRTRAVSHTDVQRHLVRIAHENCSIIPFLLHQAVWNFVTVKSTHRDRITLKQAFDLFQHCLALSDGKKQRYFQQFSHIHKSNLRKISGGIFKHKLD